MVLEPFGSRVLKWAVHGPSKFARNRDPNSRIRMNPPNTKSTKYNTDVKQSEGLVIRGLGKFSIRGRVLH